MNNRELWKALEGRVVGGKFPLRRWLGSSGHSAVCLTARDGQPCRQAAIKLIPSDPVKAERQLLLWRASVQLHHPNLIRIFDMGRTQLDGTLFLYLVMEYAEEDLSQIIPERPLSSTEVEELLPPMLDALSYLHKKGLAHGHIKPSNVHAIDDQLKLSIDQLAVLTAPAAEKTRRDVYDAPEISVGNISRASDVWSLGATLSTALTQHAPAYEALGEKDLRPSDAIAEPFRSIIRDCLRHNPNQRCSLDDIEARLQQPARSVAAIEASTMQTRPRRSALLTVSAVLSVAFVTIGVVYSCGRSRTTAPIAKVEQVTPAPPATSKNSAPATESNKSNSTKSEPVKTESPKNEAATSNPLESAEKTPSTQSEVARQIIPTVSLSARRTITGKVKVSVQVEVDPSGKVVTAKLTSPGPSKYFANLALKAAEQWEFPPPKPNRQNVSSVWLLRFSFGRTSTQVSSEPVTH